MAKPRRRASIHGNGATALTPALVQCSTPKSQDDLRLTTQINFLRKQLANERQTHGSLVEVLTRHIQTLEQQVADLRQLYFSQIALKVEGAQ